MRRWIGPVVLTVALVIMAGGLAWPETVAGRVVDPAGQPVKGTTVWLVWPADAASPQRDEATLHSQSVTGTDGVFALEYGPFSSGGAIAGPEVIARAPGFGLGYGRAAGTSGEPMIARISLTEPATLTGRIVGPDGQPLAGATVALQSLSSSTDGERQRMAIPEEMREALSVTSGADGRWALDFAPRGWRATLSVGGPGYGYWTVYNQEGTEYEEVVLEPAGSLEGKVTIPAGDKRLETIRVTAYGSDGSGRSSHRYVTDTASLSPKEGSFIFPELPPGQYSLYFGNPSDAEYLVVAQKPVTIEAGKEAVADLAALKAVIVRGKVLDADTGKGFDGIIAYVQSETALGQVYDWSDQAGDFAVPCLPGQATLRFVDYYGRYLTDLPGGQHTLTVGTEGADVGAFTFKRGARVTVEVVDAQGKPVDGAMVNIEQMSSPAPFSGRTAITAGGGEAPLRGLQAGPVTVRATYGDLASDRVTVDPATQEAPVRLVLRPDMLAAAYVKVRDQHGQPVRDAQVTLLESRENMATNLQCEPPDAQGIARHKRLTPGLQYRFRIVAPGAASRDSAEWTAGASETHNSGVIVLNRYRGSVAGKIVGPNGQPVGGVIVISPADAPARMTTVSAEDGTFRLDYLMEGPVVLLAPTGKTRCAKQTARTGQTDVVITLPADRPFVLSSAPGASAATKPGAEALRQARDLLVKTLRASTGTNAYERSEALRLLAELDGPAALQLAAEGGDETGLVKATIGAVNLPDRREEAMALLWSVQPVEVMQVLLERLVARGRDDPVLTRACVEALLEIAPAWDEPGGSAAMRAAVLPMLNMWDPDRADRILQELVQETATMGDTGGEVYARLRTARFLAEKDPDAAATLLSAIPQDLGSDQGDSVGHIARRDPARALRVIAELPDKWDRNQVMAMAVGLFPPEQFPLALAEARKIEDGFFRALALGRVLAIAPADQMPQVLQEAVETLAAQAISQGEYGGMQSGEGLMRLALLARDKGYRNYQEIAWLGAAMPTGGGYQEQVYNIRSSLDRVRMLALSDPALARHICQQTVRARGGIAHVEVALLASVMAIAAEVDPSWAGELMAQVPATAGGARVGAAVSVAKRLMTTPRRRAGDLLREQYQWAWVPDDVFTIN